MKICLNKKYQILLPGLLVLFYFLPFNVAFTNDSFCISINTAPKEELIKIRHIGDVRAEQIMELRKEKLFSSIDDLNRVYGIGPARISDIKEQGLACIELQPTLPLKPKLKTQEESTLQTIKKFKPNIALSYAQNNSANKEIKVTLFASNLENTNYDLKISIEKEKNISDIYNKKEEKWQSSHYYINNLFSGSFFEETMNLKIKEQWLNFQGEADILVRIRESGKSNYLEYRDKINITVPERPTDRKTEKELASLSEQSFKIPLLDLPLQDLSIAFGLSVFSGITILILKKKTKN